MFGVIRPASGEPLTAMNTAELQATVDAAWEARDTIDPATKGPVRQAVDAALEGLDSGALRVAEKRGGQWHVQQWLKKAVLLSFRLYDMYPIGGGPTEAQRGSAAWWDKVPSKFAGWDAGRFRKAGFRAVPGAIVRRSAFVAPGVVLMPSFVNIGAYVDTGTMVDTWATVGSCAQVGKNVHLSGGVGIGGVLEPPQAAPVIIEDDCLIGSRSMVTQGARVGRGSVLGEASLLNPGIPVIDSETGKELGRGVVPPGCLCVQATRKRKFKGGKFWLPCLLVLRRIKSGEREHLNEILRESGVTVG